MTFGKGLVFGSSGYIGSVLCKLLAKRGIDHLSPKRNQVDLSLQLGKCPLLDEQFDFMVYTAGRRKSEVNRDGKSEVDLRMLRNALTLPKAFSRLFYISTVDVYGSSPALPISELTSVGTNVSPYAQSRILCEKFVEDFCAAHEIPYLILRLPGVFANTQSRAAMLDQIADYLLGIPTKFQPRQKGLMRDYLSVYEVFNFIEHAMLSVPCHSLTLNLVRGTSLSLSAWLHLVARRLELPDSVKWAEEFGEESRRSSGHLVFDAGLLRRNFPNFQFDSPESALEIYESLPGIMPQVRVGSSRTWDVL